MSMIHDRPHVAGSAFAPPDQLPAGPAGPGLPDSTGQAGEWSGPPRHRRRALLAVAACLALAAAGAGAASLALGGTTHRTTRSALTTAQIAAGTDPALVDVVATLGYQRATSSGTGIVLTSSGEVLTNNHVIEGATSISVTDVGNGRSYRAVVVGYDQEIDLAVLQLQHASGLTTAVLGTSATVKVGDVVVAIGNAGGQGGTPSAVTGKVTALEQSITASDQSAGTVEYLAGLIRTDARIQAGDSGGPLVNSHGQVVGIDTAASSAYQLEAGTAPVESFAIPVSTALSIADTIEAGQASGSVHIGATAFIGVRLLSGSGLPGGTGVTVAGVEPGLPAATAGLQPGDEITSVAGHQVSAPADVQATLGAYHPGDKISIGWLDQAGQAHNASVVLAAGPAG
jgi:S1-C subfamily serine protease